MTLRSYEKRERKVKGPYQGIWQSQRTRASRLWWVLTSRLDNIMAGTSAQNHHFQVYFHLDEAICSWGEYKSQSLLQQLINNTPDEGSHFSSCIGPTPIRLHFIPCSRVVLAPRCYVSAAVLETPFTGVKRWDTGSYGHPVQSAGATKGLQFWTLPCVCVAYYSSVQLWETPRPVFLPT